MVDGRLAPLLLLALAAPGCAMQWGLGEGEAAPPPAVGTRRLGDAEMARLERQRTLLEAELQKVESKLAAGYHEPTAERRLRLVVAHREVEAAFSRRAKLLRNGQVPAPREPIPDSLDALLEQAADRIERARLAREERAKRRVFRPGPVMIEGPPEEMLERAEERERGEGSRKTTGRPKQLGERDGERADDPEGKDKGTREAARVLTGDAPPADVLPAVRQHLAALEACLPPTLIETGASLEVVARLARQGRLSGARVTATPSLSPAVAGCLADALEGVQVPAPDDSRVVRFGLRVGGS